jgi:hypothetical protein
MEAGGKLLRVREEILSKRNQGCRVPHFSPLLREVGL